MILLKISNNKAIYNYLQSYLQVIQSTALISKSSTGYDNISNKLIKHTRTVLVKPLTLLENQIIHTGEFPRQLKIARVKPLFKKGDETSFSNYRPISLLPSISKIFENVMAAQLVDYFTTNNLFCIQQFGFRPGHSTELGWRII